MENSESLLLKLKELYATVSRLLFKQQVKSYHPGLGNVSATMAQLIDDLVSDVSTLSDTGYREAGNILHTQGKPAAATSIAPPPVSDLNATVNNDKKPEVDTDSLATEFKSQHQPSMKTSLQDSTWEHVHSAHRYAREGNREKALFHIKLASDALDTLRYYMAGAEYENFVTLIYQQLGMKSRSH